ncbi:phytoene desaturase family protein (plasmid) [Anabaena sp. FACHB-709]|uniref:Zeta-carotene desaturase n=2 Tax=Nostocaceae TaxID=1162 RepID=A0A1Z4KV92_ANAVA|nr:MULTISPECIES: phytoene desaturase family protein [Nostocaceae]BAY72945.1 zeta-carotene desaturase [Trichormus variabilis NIES-23]MBD2175252.1 phytoene desaturase [Anabaena cylindrica FACHB-318]MBD2267148.1 phytoene desaturase [Anabaena sp. FACHB-709]MBD2276700.1 phytoene desaturase [Nostoc sp. PCC 7120 = FACHB-418]MBD2287206.1 phytoene desaturase [Anabaena cylindrica FACHB-170]
MSKKVAIVGAGPGGLATAIRLAGLGYQVEIFEAAERVGGRMRGFEVDSYAFDTGPTILQLPHLYKELFEEAGLNFADYVQLKRLEPYTRLKFWDGTQLDITSDLQSFKTQLATLRSDLPLAFDRWYSEHIRKYELGYKPYLAGPARSIFGYLRPDELMKFLSFRPWENLYQHFWRFFQDERLVYALSYPSKYLGMHPTVASSVFSLIPFLEFSQGVWHPVGGFRALAQGLANAAQDLGVKIHLHSPVHQIWIEQGQVRGLELADASRHQFDTVVINADFAYAVRHLLPTSARGRYTDNKLGQMQFSCSTFMLYLGINRRYEDLPHHQIYLSDNIRRLERPWVDDSALDETDPPFYVCNPTIIDPSNAPAGHSTLFVLVPIPNTSYAVDWDIKQKSYTDFILKRLHLLGYHNIEQHIVTQSCYTAQSWLDDYRVHLGAVFNLSHNLTQLGPFRPPIRSENIAGLYWIGGAVHPGSGLLTILEASRSAAGFIHQDFASTGS